MKYDGFEWGNSGGKKCGYKISQADFYGSSAFGVSLFEREKGLPLAAEEDKGKDKINLYTQLQAKDPAGPRELT